MTCNIHQYIKSPMLVYFENHCCLQRQKQESIGCSSFSQTTLIVKSRHTNNNFFYKCCVKSCFYHTMRLEIYLHWLILALCWSFHLFLASALKTARKLVRTQNFISEQYLLHIWILNKIQTVVSFPCMSWLCSTACTKIARIRIRKILYVGISYGFTVRSHNKPHKTHKLCINATKKYCNQ